MTLFYRILIVLITNAAIAFSAQAQVYTATSKGGGDTIVFRVLDNNPDNIYNLYGGLGLGIDIPYAAGFEGSVRYFWNNTIMLQFDYLMAPISLFDFPKGSYITLGDGPSNGSNKIELKPFNRANLVAAFYFAEKKTFPQRNIVLTSEVIDGNEIIYITKMEVSTATRFGVRAGYHNYNTSVTSGFLLDIDNNTFLTSYSMNSLAIGLSANRFQHLRIETEDEFESERTLVHSYYIDLMLGFAGNYNLHHQFGDQYEPFESVPPPMDFNNMGFRLGWELLIPSRPSKIPYGSLVGAEFCFRPVFDAENLDSPNQLKAKKIPRVSVNLRFIRTLHGRI
ncbi:MAG: hypothetical protein WD077_13550 [Bacteroidia bacterium]